MKRILIIMLVLFSYNVVAQVTDPTPRRFTGGLYTAIGGSAPTPLGQGGLWTNTSTGMLNFYNGSIWIPTIQSLSLTSVPGQLSLSNSNTVTLSSLFLTSYPAANTLPTTSGFHVSTNTTGSTDYPSASGASIKLLRGNATGLGYFEFWKSNTTAGDIYFRAGTGASTFTAWDIVVGRNEVAATYATSAALALKANLASPTGTGTATWPNINGSTSVSAGNLMMTGASLFGTSASASILYSSSTGSVYPFLTNSNLVFQSRGNASSDIVFATGTTAAVRGYYKGSTGNLHIGYTDGSDTGNKLAVNGSFLASSGQISGAPVSGNDIVRKTDLDAVTTDRVKYGSTVVTFDGVQTVFNLAHGMGSVPASISITFGNAANDNFVKSTRTVTSTNIVLTCDSPPLAGSQTVYWQVFK